MNILNKLTIKHLKMNKKRTLVTIIGITLSTALMVGIGLLVSTFLTTMRLDAEDSFGRYHLSIENLSEEKYQVLEKNVKIDKSYYYTPLGFAKIDSENDYKPYLYVTECNKEFLEELKLVEGTLPKNSDELVISSHILSDANLKYKIGDTITLDIGKRYYENEYVGSKNTPTPRSWEEDGETPATEELRDTTSKTYKIVGIVERTPYEDYMASGYMVFSYSKTIPTELNAFVELKKPKDTFEIKEELADYLDIADSQLTANQSLLFYYGATKYENVNNTFIPLILIALSVISIGCIIVIYNSFAISTMERKKSFGLYASIGATMKQIKKTVLFEAFVVGTIGIILGILGGFLGIYVVVEILNHLLKDIFAFKLVFSVDLMYLLIPLIFMVVVILLSAYLPAKRSSKVTPIEAIRGNDDIKISKNEVKTPKLVGKCFGIEGDLAFKNMKRNKKKYRVTIISLFISIVMFNTFTSFLAYTLKTSDTVDYFDYDIGYYLSDDHDTIKEDIETIKRTYKIDKSLEILHTSMIKINLTLNDYTTMYKNLYSKDLSKLNENILILIISDQDYSKITNSEALLLNKKYFTTYDNNNRKTVETKVFNKKSYTFDATYNETTKRIIAEVTDKDNFGLKSFTYNPFPILLISEKTFTQNFSEDNYNAQFIIDSKEYKKMDEDIDNKKINLKSEIIEVSSPAIDMSRTKNLVLAIKILFYGFIALVTLIGVTSVINTVNTSMNLRRKEFAMLRSVGLTPRGFNKILFFESMLFGLKSLLYGLPVSIAINALISLSIGQMFATSMIIPWKSLAISIIGVFVIVLISMNYASKKIKKENILEALREENI